MTIHNEISGIYALWKREIIRFFRAKSRIVGSIAMPLFFLVILGVGLNTAVAIPGLEEGYLAFLAPGIIAMTLLFASMFSGITVIMDRQFGFMKEIMVAPISRISIVMGKALGGATTALFQGILVSAIAVFLGVQFNLINALLVLAYMLVISVSFVSFGIALASLMEDMHGFQLIMNFIIMPMFFLSGAIFPISNLPFFIRFFSYIDPLSYGVDGLRYLLIGVSDFPLWFDASISIVFCAVIMAAATYLFSRIE